MKDHNQYHRNRDSCYNILSTTICQQIRQSGRNGCIPSDIETTKTEPGRNRKPEQTHNQQGN